MNDNDYTNQDHQSFDGQQGQDSPDMLSEGNDFGAEQNFEMLTGSSSEKRSISGGALILGIVVVCAAAGLFGMRTLTQASAVTTAPTETEESIESFLEVIAGRGADDAGDVVRPLGENERAVLQILNESYASRQVPLDHVQRNPFIIFEDIHRGETPRESQPQGPEIDPLELQREQTRARFEQAGRQFRLRSVLMGSTPLANLDNEIVQVGDKVGGRDNVTFTVEQIESDYIVLAAEDQEIDVKVSVTVHIERLR